MYAECGVQTDIPALASAGVQADMHAASSYRMIATVDIRGESTTLSELILSPPRPRHRSVSVTLQDQSAYIEQNSLGESDEQVDDSVDMKSDVREYQRHPLSYKLPKDRTLKSISARVVSLPETASAFSAKRVVGRIARVVSQPERNKSVIYSDISSPLSDGQDTSCDILDPFVSESHQRARVRVRSNVTDLPHTPSPPSSPESVLIIADKTQLPKGFLSTLDLNNSPSAHADDEGLHYFMFP